MARLSNEQIDKLRSIVGRSRGTSVPAAIVDRYGTAGIGARRTAEEVRSILDSHDDLSAEAATLRAEVARLRAEVARLRGVVDTMAKAARFASSEVRRAAAMPGNSLYGLCNVAVNLDASLDAVLAEHDAGRAADGPGGGQRGG